MAPNRNDTMFKLQFFKWIDFYVGLRVLGIGRNEYLALISELKTNSTKLFRKPNPLNFLPKFPVRINIEPWWKVEIGYVLESDVKVSPHFIYRIKNKFHSIRFDSIRLILWIHLFASLWFSRITFITFFFHSMQCLLISIVETWRNSDDKLSAIHHLNWTHFSAIRMKLQFMSRNDFILINNCSITSL